MLESNSHVLDPGGLYLEGLIIGVFLHFEFGGLIWEFYGISGTYRNHSQVSEDQMAKLIFIEEYVAKVIGNNR